MLCLEEPVSERWLHQGRFLFECQATNEPQLSQPSPSYRISVCCFELSSRPPSSRSQSFAFARGWTTTSLMQASSIHGHEAEVSTLVCWRVSGKCVAYHDGQTALFQGSRPSHLSLTRTSVYSPASGLESFGYPFAHIVLAYSKRMGSRHPLSSPCRRSRYRHNRTSGIALMHSFPGGSRAPAKWLETQFEYTGAACSRYDTTWRVPVLYSL
ncbi:hypothetical protein EDC04DRAFT_1761449 [Pisolithus marmoratus]|nr:hypothetical protein EDC04DRAFT_1761449 [Pisolithus marmoratus]